MRKLLLSICLVWAASGCVTDDEENRLPDDLQEYDDQAPQEPDEDPTVNVVLPDQGNTTCGGAPRLKADGPCVPPK